MNVIPAIDVKGGKCVQLVGGRPGTEAVQIDDVCGVALRWQEEGAGMIHVVDLDSALGSGDNGRLIERMIGELRVPVQVGGGVRSVAKVDRLFDMGSERVVIGTKAIQDRRFAEEVSENHRDAIVISVDSSYGEVLVDGWQGRSGLGTVSVAKGLAGLPIWGFLYTNVDVEGRLQGIDAEPVAELVRAVRKPVIASGGITTQADLDSLRSVGAHSAVVGMAIYTGVMDFSKVVREFA
jgi:phosphoribosylformimino-5-aminoimidazole carboxamide ribotide isomerase